MAKKVTELKVTDIETLVKSANAEIVQLPSFTEDVPFYAKVKRPSLLGLVKSGKIPVILQSDIFTHKFTTLQTGALKKKDHRLKVVFSLIRQPFSTFSSSSG